MALIKANSCRKWQNIVVLTGKTYAIKLQILISRSQKASQMAEGKKKSTILGISPGSELPITEELGSWSERDLRQWLHISGGGLGGRMMVS